jgi:hypothetical protein
MLATDDSFIHPQEDRKPPGLPLRGRRQRLFRLVSRLQFRYTVIIPVIGNILQGDSPRTTGDL